MRSLLEILVFFWGMLENRKIVLYVLSDHKVPNTDSAFCCWMAILICRRRNAMALESLVSFEIVFPIASMTVKLSEPKYQSSFTKQVGTSKHWKYQNTSLFQCFFEMPAPLKIFDGDCTFEAATLSVNA